MVLLFALLAPIASAATTRALIYKSDACSHCAPYLGKLFPVLEAAGIRADQTEVRDFINNPERRKEVALLQEKYGVPLTMQGHMLTVIDGTYVLEGHIPLAAVESLLKGPKPQEPVILYQDSMASNVVTYEMLSGGQKRECTTAETPWDCQAKTQSALPDDLQKFLLPGLLVVIAGVVIGKYGFGK
ncbi:hypothetical protein HZC09_00575 [Candidatus Micrarchaeota archaeon]|nr:hypothetical protein [Candidatus Micrarchaeota archaeon]